MATLDELIQTLNADDVVDVGADFVINSDMRVIAVPHSGVVLGVEGDKDVNTVRFKINRYYDGNDLSTFIIRVNYANAHGDLDYFNATNVVTTDDSLTFDWLVSQYATAYVGAVRFVVRFLKVDASGNVTQAFNTTDATATVLEGMTVDNQLTPTEIQDIRQHLYNDLYGSLYPLVSNAASSAFAADNSKNASANSAAAALASQQEAKRIVDSIPVIPADYSALSQRVLSTGFVVVGGKLCVTYNT